MSARVDGHVKIQRAFSELKLNPDVLRSSDNPNILAIQRNDRRRRCDWETVKARPTRTQDIHGINVTPARSTMCAQDTRAIWDWRKKAFNGNGDIEKLSSPDGRAVKIEKLKEMPVGNKVALVWAGGDD